jgi:hypothetical protein
MFFGKKGGGPVSSSGVRPIKGKASRVKGRRDWSDKTQFIEVHQTDYYAGKNPQGYVGMKTNLAITDDNQVLEVHPVEEVVVDNYSDFSHIETSGVYYGLEGVENTVNRVVKDKNTGKVYTRVPSVFTPAKEAALEVAILHLVKGFRAHGIEPTIIFHSQTFKKRVHDPGQAIAQATQRIVRRHNLKFDPTFTRPGGSPVRAEWRI